MADESVGAKPGHDWVELAAMLLLALAAVATAWSSYQANRWNGEQVKAGARTNAIRIEAARAAGLANAQTEVDVATFMQWVDAHARDETELTDFYLRRFRKEFKPAFNAWLATDPLENAGAPLTPFAMPEYQLAATEDAERLDAEAEVSAATVRRNIQRSSELRARRRPLRRRAVLRRDERQAGLPECAQDAARARLGRLPGRRCLDRDLPDQPLGLVQRVYDAIVVGARCAGARDGDAARAQGLDVLLVDRAAFPSEIPHGHFIHRHGPQRLADWGLLDRVLATGCPPSRR